MLETVDPQNSKWWCDNMCTPEELFFLFSFSERFLLVAAGVVNRNKRGWVGFRTVTVPWFAWSFTDVMGVFISSQKLLRVLASALRALSAPTLWRSRLKKCVCYVSD